MEKRDHQTESIDGMTPNSLRSVTRLPLLLCLLPSLRGSNTKVYIFLTAGPDNGVVCSVAHSEFVCPKVFRKREKMTTARMLDGSAGQRFRSHKSHEP